MTEEKRSQIKKKRGRAFTFSQLRPQLNSVSLSLLLFFNIYICIYRTPFSLFWFRLSVEMENQRGVDVVIQYKSTVTYFLINSIHKSMFLQ